MAAAETRSARILAIGSSISSLTIRVLPRCGGAFGKTGCTSATLKRSRSISSPHLRDRLDRMRNMRSTCTSHILSGRRRPGSGVGADPGGRRRGVSPSRKRTRAMCITLDLNFGKSAFETCFEKSWYLFVLRIPTRLTLEPPLHSLGDRQLGPPGEMCVGITSRLSWVGSSTTSSRRDTMVAVSPASASVLMSATARFWSVLHTAAYPSA
jgi:hypothetical protein